MTFTNDLATLIHDAHRAKSFREIATAAPTVLAGLGSAQAAALMDALQVKTVEELGRSKYVMWAQAIATLAAHEKPKAEASAVSNTSLAAFLDTKWETRTLRDVTGAPPSALAGLTAKADKALHESLGIQTIQDLATNRYIRLAQVIGQLAEFEGATDKARRAA
jgi:hypothetical protein